MKLILISDTHNRHREVNIPEGDILIHSGDFSGQGNPYEVEDFLDWFSNQPHTYKIFIAGNHDMSFEDKPEWLIEMLDKLPPNVFYLEDSEMTIDEIKFYGSPWQPEFHNWAFNLPRGEQLVDKWNKIPLDTNVLITHGPSYLNLDYTIFGHQSVGCHDLLYKVQEVKPQIHTCGHIHGAYGSKYNEYTAFFNASICDERYQPTNKPWVIDLDLNTKKITDYFQAD
jgi:predicted phosphodiesterase